MKYKISLVLIFSCIVAVFGSDKKVKGLSFTFCCLQTNLCPLTVIAINPII